MSKKLIVLFILIPASSLLASDLCKIREAGKPIYQAKDGTKHIYFTRCHPTLPLAFSNRLITGRGLAPVMIDMKSGKITPLEIPKNMSAEDMVPSPDGKYLYVDLGRPDLNMKGIGVYKLVNGKPVKEFTLESDGIGDYSYPSPAIRSGHQMLLTRSSRNGETPKVYLDQVDANKRELKHGPELCPEHAIVLDRPYISPDGEYFGTSLDNEMTILKVRWDKVDKNATSVPCDVVRKLPATSGKVAFSLDNKKVVFHASRHEFLGKSAKKESRGPQSYFMDLETGKTVELTPQNKGTSEYPYFCGDQGIIVRESINDSNVSFRMLPIPKVSSDNENCELPSATDQANATNFWNDVCEALNPSELRPAYDIQVTPENCKKLLETWKKRKIKSDITEAEILAACREGSSYL